jgi:NAD(P)-dependent dehydrogenase (short-subunit alcohol dehydrogenase family)
VNSTTTPSPHTCSNFLTISKMTTCILVTGANQGLGHSVVKQLLVQGRDLLIYAACRDLEKAKKNIEILSTTPEAHSSNRLEAAAVDLNDDVSIENAAHLIPRLDILVNNAGIYCE